MQPPHKLSPDVSLREFKVWRGAWADYEELLQLRDQSARMQLAHFRSCLTPEMRGTLVHAIGVAEDDHSLSVDDLLAKVHGHFQRQRNVTLRRVRFEERRQGDGECFDDFYVNLKELADDAELCDTCLDSRLVTRITSGVISQPLRTKLLAIDPPPTLPDVLRLCRSEESAVKTGTELDHAAGTVRRVTARKPRSASHSRWVARSKCGGCGGEPHAQGRQKQCIAWGKKCNNCGILGHFGKVCSRKRADGGAADTTQGKREKAAHSLRIRDVHLASADRHAPKVFVSVSSSEIPMATRCRLQFTPDTGAEVTAIGLRHLRLLGLSISDLSRCQEEVLAADRGRLRPVGVFDATLTLGTATTDTTLRVFHDVDDALLSWYDARALRLIPDTYPQQISSLRRDPPVASSAVASQIEEGRQAILREFRMCWLTRMTSVMARYWAPWSGRQ